MSQGSRPALSAASPYFVFISVSVCGRSEKGKGRKRSAAKRRSVPSSGITASGESEGISSRWFL